MANRLSWIVLLCVTCVLSGCGCEQVEAGNVGVVKHLGALQPNVLPEGFHWINVLDDVIEVGTQTWAQTAEATGASKDLQAVHTKVTVQWSTAPDRAVCLVQKFGEGPGMWSGGIMEPAIQEVVKAVSAKYTAEQLITHRADAKAAIEEALNIFVKKTLESRKCDNAVRIANVAVTNFEFSKEFNASIEAKVKAEQDALRAENEKRTRITQAEAKAKEQTLAAEATAFSIEAESKARAAAIERESKALASNPALVQLRIAEKWDGKLPTMTGASIPLLNMTP
jgi:prohibitin 2